MSCHRYQLPHDLQKTMNKFKKSLGLGKKEKSLTPFMVQGFLVEHRGFEPLTSTLRTLRATNCANAPYSDDLNMIAHQGWNCKRNFREFAMSTDEAQGRMYGRKKLRQAAKRWSGLCVLWNYGIAEWKGTLLLTFIWGFCKIIMKNNGEIYSFEEAILKKLWTAQMDKSLQGRKQWIWSKCRSAERWSW